MFLSSTRRGMVLEVFLSPGSRPSAVCGLEVRFAAADAVFYIQEGKVRLTVVSESGREATVGILNAGQFFGEGALAGQHLRMGLQAP